MTNNSQRIVYKNMGVVADPPPPGRAKTVTRTYFCSCTNTTKKVVRSVYFVKGGNNEEFRRTSLLERTPARSPSEGFHTREEKRTEAAERAAITTKLTPQDKLKRLDRRLGAGVGAQRERQRLLSQIALEKAESAKTQKAEQQAEKKSSKKERAATAS